MPRCEGLPSGPCPLKKNDSLVVIGKGDLMLCKSCDTERRRLFDCPVASKDESKQELVVRPAGLSLSAGKEQAPPSASAASLPDVPASTNDPADHATIEINELLSYVSFYRSRASVDCLRKVVASFYTPSEISAAKKVLLSMPGFNQSLIDCPLRAERRKSANRVVHEVEIDDIIGIMGVLDRKSLLSQVIFAAVNHERLPKYGPEELNICTIADRQVVLSNSVTSTVQSIVELRDSVSSVASIAQAIDEMRGTVQEVQCIVGELNTSVQGALAASASGSGSGRHDPVVAYPAETAKPSQLIQSVDRSRNVVLFGIPENGPSDGSWRDTVAEVLKMATGRTVGIQDAFRLGKQMTAEKRRPVLVKLQSVWDRRAVVAGSWKLSTADEMKDIFISPDLPLEARRRKTMDRLLKSFTHKGKDVSLVDGVLSVDGCVMYTLENGAVPRNHDD